VRAAKANFTSKKNKGKLGKARFGFNSGELRGGDNLMLRGMRREARR